MDLSQKLKQARLAAGLSQKALCGDRITRNMLSQIENGCARPSMDTLRYLAGQLGKPLSYFLEDDAVTSPNQALMAQARETASSEVLQLLGQYKGPDPTFDRERWFLEALACLNLAEEAIAQNKPTYALTLLERAAAAGRYTPYYTADNERRRLLLQHQAGRSDFDGQLLNIDRELLLLADAALRAQDVSRCAAYLGCVTAQTPRYHYIMAQMHFAQKAYAEASPHFEAAWDCNPKLCCSHLEDCCRETGDFAGAYFYACKLRELGRDFTKI